MSNQGTRGGHSSSFGGQNDHLNRDRPFGRSQDGHNKRPRSPSGLEQDGPGKQRRQTNTQEPEFFGLFRGADNCFAGLGTMETLYKTLDGEWSEEMKRCVPFRVYQSVGALDNVRLFERYIAVRGITLEMCIEGLRYERLKRSVSRNNRIDPMTPIRVSRAVRTCQWLRTEPRASTGRNGDVLHQLLLWELDYRMYFQLEWPKGDAKGRQLPQNLRATEDILQQLETAPRAQLLPAEPPTELMMMRVNGFPVTGFSVDVHSALDAELIPEIRALVETFIIKDYSHIPSVEQILGNSAAKIALRVHLALKFEMLAEGTSEHPPWKGGSSVLLYGPNEVGKTSMCLAAAKEAGRTVFKLTNNHLCNGVVGYSEKIIRELFAMAKDKASSVIFLDEIDKIVGPSTNQDSFRGRLEAELRNHWDDAIRESWDVVILGTTSSVDEVPKGVISRFTECIKVARVSSEAIRTLVLEQLDLPHSLSEANLRQISTRLAAVGPREVEYFVRALKRRAQSKLLKARYFRKMRVRFENQLQEVWVPCREGEEGWTETSYAVLSDGSELVGPEPISFEDCLRALSDEENDNEQEGTVLQ